MAQTHGIMAYGKPEDRLRLAALARLSGKSSSEWLIETIRKAYFDVYGNAPPPPLPKEKAK